MGESTKREWAMAVLTAGAVFACWVCTPVLHAQAPIDAQARDQEARRLFEAGRAAYVDEKYRDALNYFQQSHELSGRPQLLFNIGQAADRAGEREIAARAFRDYLAAVPDADNRPEVEARIAALETSDAVAYPAGLPGLQESATAELRSGLYLRGAFGLGAFADQLNRNLGEDKAKASGAALSGEIAVGYALLPGFALAGVLTAEGTQSELDVGEGGKVGPLLTLGGMVDFYLWPERGWHLQGGFGLSHLTVAGASGTFVGDHGAAGFTLFGGGGHEWHIRDKLAIGVLGRITLGQVKGDEITHNVLAISVLASATIF